MFFKKYSPDKIDYYLILLLTILSIFSLNAYGDSALWFLQKDNVHETFGKFSLIEFIQLVLLILNIFLILKNRKFLLKQSNNLIIFTLRIFIPILVIFEETSFYFKDFFKENYFKEINVQGEFNIHNSPIMGIKLFENNQYGQNFLPDNITLGMVIYCLIFILFSLGAFLPFIKRFSFIFFEKRFLLFGLIYIFNIIISFLMRKFFGILNNHYLLSDEFIELFYYQLLFLDLRKKILKSKL